MVCCDAEAFTADEVEAPCVPEFDVWLEPLPPHALSSPAHATESVSRRIATILPLAVAMIKRGARRGRARRR